jgi:hypothetical protein
LITTCSASSWIDAPYDHSSARPAMFESISCDIPIPTWMPWLFLISAPPRSRSSHVLGPFGRPTGVHRLER